ncbi:MAG: AI-2E family transporter [Candidatus Cloacimonetes bacterium]|nr:AI-2E family transporter [Candidatus Cloacimonadota bacterium]
MDNLRWIRFAVIVIALAIVVVILKELKAVFVPLTFALLLTFIFMPLQRFLRRRGVPGAVVVIIMVVIIFFTFTIAGTLVYTGVASFIDAMPRFMNNVVQLAEDIALRFEIPIEDVQKTIREIDWTDMFDRFRLQDRVQGTLGTFADFLLKLGTTIVFMVFIVAGRERLLVRIYKTMTNKEQEHSQNIFIQIEEQIIKYLFTKSLVSLATALVGMFFVWLFGVEFVIVSGLLLFILNFIPNIGSIIASAFPIIVCFFQYGLSWRLVGLAVTLILTQAAFGTLIEPRLVGSKLNLAPIVILISLIFWAWVWGPVGMVLAVPFAAVLAIFAREFESLKLLSALLSDD